MIAINLSGCRFNYWLLFAAMAVHSMGVGVSVSLSPEMGQLGLDRQVSGLKSCALFKLPIGMR